MTPPTSTADAEVPTHRARRLTLLGAALVLAVGVGVLSQLGNAAPALLTVAVVMERLVFAGGAALAYILAAAGLGRFVRPWLGGSVNALAVQSAAGLAVLLWLSHLLGWVGLLGGAAGSYVAGAVILAGVSLAGHQFFTWIRAGGFEPRMPALGILGSVGAAVLVVAACNPPGWLWDSEFGGYDAMSYHLALPQEWLAQGRLAPLENNVYSFLPGYVEAAFMHLGAMMFAPGPSERPWGLVAGEGYPAYACQLLNVLMTLLAAWWSGRAAAAAAARCGLEEPQRASALSAVLTLVTPWAVVTGSLAYNDMGVVAMLGAALIVVFEPALPPMRRGVLAGLLIGAACSIKPTALLFAACPTAFLLALTVPRRDWTRLALGGAGAFLVMIAPWLTRNWIASGNPIFPFLHAVFPNALGGTGHWTAEQVARYAAAHRFDGSLAARLSLAFVPEALREGVTETSRWRGMSHPQWGLIFPLILPALLACLLSARTRGTGLLLAGAVLIQILVWLLTTHIQSRFLLPVLAPATILAGIAAASIRIRPVATGLAWIVCLVQAGILVDIFVGQRPPRPGLTGQPNALLVGGIHARTGEIGRTEFAELSTRDRVDLLARASPEWYINWSAAGAKVYLLGGATPLYYTPRVVYNSTWDSWLFGEVVEANPGRPDAWSGALGERGIELVLIDLGEINRLTRSGWIDPRVKLDDVTAWMSEHTTLLRSWPEAGIYLVSVRTMERRP